MTDRPILFSGEMVRAILSGSKTQTRRVVTRRLKDEGEWCSTRPDRGYTPESIAAQFPNPYGQPGDRLWVREELRPWGDAPYLGAKYAADDRVVSMVSKGGGMTAEAAWPRRAEYKVCPPMFMPRWASRITLEITNVRVERVQDISDADCIAEGCSGGHDSIPGYGFSATPAEHYQNLWDRINSPRGYGWDVNPWVWVIEFKPVSCLPHSDTPRKP